MQFSYQASKERGENVAGQIEADSLADAILQLQAGGLNVQSIKQLTPIVTASAMVQDQLEQTIHQDVSLVPRLSAFADEMPPSRWRRQLRSLIGAIDRGVPADRLAVQYPAWAPLLAANLASASGGDSVGDLMIGLSEHHENRKRMWKAVCYPLALLALAFGILVVLSYTAIAQFSSMFDEFGLQLPAPTILLVGFSREVTDHPVRFWFLTLLVVCGVLALAWFWIESRFARSVHPPAGQRATELAAMISQVANYLSDGATLENALRLVSQGNNRFANQIAGALVRNVVMKSQPAAGLLPPNVLYALGFHEGSADATREPNIPMLRELGDLYRDHQWDRDERWYSVISAFAVIAVGVTIGFIVIALFMPLVSLVSGLS